MDKQLTLSLSYAGLPVVIATTIKSPKFRISESLILSDGFKKEIDEWINEFFGFYYYDAVADGQVFNSNGTLIMNKTTYNALVKGMQKCN